MDDHPVSSLRLPPGYKKLLPSLTLVENLTNPPRWSTEASTIEDKPSEPIPDEIQKVKATVDPILPSEVPSSDDTVTEENKDDTVQILFVSTDSDEKGRNLPIPLPKEGSSSESYLAIYSFALLSNLVVSFD